MLSLPAGNTDMAVLVSLGSTVEIPGFVEVDSVGGFIFSTIKRG